MAQNQPTSSKTNGFKRFLRIIEVLFFALIFMSFFVIIIYMAATGLLRGHSALETKSSLITLQAEYEKDFTIDEANFNEPKIIVNPYKNSPLTALVIFKTANEIAPTVEIKGKDEKTTISHTFPASREHFLPIYGLYADYNNTVTMSYEINGQKNISVLNIKTDPLPESVARAEITSTNTEQLDNQLYFFSPSGNNLSAAYDINGDVRWYLVQKTAWDNARLKNGHLLISTERLMNTPYYMTGLYEIDLLGKIYNEYTVPGGYHHDYFEMPNGNLLIASDNFAITNNTVEDYLVEIERESGKIIKQFDLKDVLTTTSTGNENYSEADWFHNNSVWYDENSNTVILSGRHQDAIVALDYATGSLKWILGDKTNWPEEYAEYFFTPVGENFEWQWSQHAAMLTPEGNIFLFDNGNNKSKLSDNYTPAAESYSRGVMYHIDYDAKTIEQVYQYGKERGAEFYSPYISDVDYLEADHYLISSGGIVKKNGEAQNQPASIAEADELNSITVEQKSGETIFEIKLPINTYRAEKMPAYYDHEAQLKLGQAKSFGELQQSTANDVSYGLMNGTRKIDDNYKSHNISFTAEEDRLGIKGDFAKDSSFEIILTKGFEKRSYKFRATKEAHAALCVSSFVDTSTESNESINIERYINNTSLSGLYNIYLRLGDTIYDTGRSIKF